MWWLKFKEEMERCDDSNKWSHSKLCNLHRHKCRSGNINGGNGNSFVLKWFEICSLFKVFKICFTVSGRWGKFILLYLYFPFEISTYRWIYLKRLIESLFEQDILFYTVLIDKYIGKVIVSLHWYYIFYWFSLILN